MSQITIERENWDGIEVTRIRDEALGEFYDRAVLENGLTVLMAPNPAYSTAHAMFGVHYGSVDEILVSEEKQTVLPDGIAHFMEHKMFEDEDGDAFVRFSQTGANANAYTTFDRTVYLFSGGNDHGQFEESLAILLDFVQRPYFTNASVQKEQGIIGQEIQMYEDSADWVVFFQMIAAMYGANGVRKDTVGTVDSIAKITPQLLYDCYEQFYVPGNMALSLAGNFDPKRALALCARLCKTKAAPAPLRAAVTEPKSVLQHLVQKKMPVSKPMFHLGFKLTCSPDEPVVQQYVNSSIAAGCLFDDTTDLYARLYDEGLINPEFDASGFQESGAVALICEGESLQPEKVAERLVEGAKHALETGLDKQVFEGVRRAFLGKVIRSFQDPGGVASGMLDAAFYDVDVFSIYHTAAELTKEQLERWLRNCLTPAENTLSIVLPMEQPEQVTQPEQTQAQTAEEDV